jgi:hypothetical protein
MCAQVGNQRSRGVVTAQFKPMLFGVFIINIEISTNQLTHTSRKIRTHPTIKWYQILGFPWGILVCLLVCFLFSYRDPPKKPQKNHIFRCPITLRATNFISVTWLSLCPSWLSLVAG